MIRIGTIEESRAAQRSRHFPDHEHFRGTLEYLFDSTVGERPAPQAYLVTQEPDWNFTTHYHREEQFQVVVGGGGSIGSHALAPIMVHYASREAGYGPLVSGNEGLHYFTLRAVTDSGAWYLPKFRDQMNRGLKKRQDTVGPIARFQGPLNCSGAGIDEIIEPATTGLAAWAVQVAANTAMTPPAHPNSGGRFYVVIDGDIEYADQQLPALACIFTSSDEGALELKAGESGARVLVLQFPDSALAPRPGIEHAA